MAAVNEMATAHFRGPKPYSPDADFSLWVRRFEAYARAATVPEEQLSDALLALLDDAAFRAFDLLGLTSVVRADYKQLVAALSRRFAPTTGEPALRLQLGQRRQESTETLDEFADAVLHLANRAYPELEANVRMRLARDRFVAGVQADYIQEYLLQTAPESFDDARRAAKRLEAARAARKQMQTTAKAVAIHSVERSLEDGLKTPSLEVTAVTRGDQSLREAVQQNTRAVQKLVEQMAMMQVQTPMPAGRRPPRGRTLTCWKCGEPGHVRRNCPSGNEDRPAMRVNRRPLN